MTDKPVPMNDLERHIGRFPSNFDDTSIASQLRAIPVSVGLYAEIRDALWIKLRHERVLREGLLNKLVQITTIIEE